MPIHFGKGDGKPSSKFRKLVFRDPAPQEPADSPYKGLDSTDIYGGLPETSNGAPAQDNRLPESFLRALFGDHSDEPDAMHRAAKKMLPADQSPEIHTAIELCEDINITSLITARIIEDTYRGFLPDENVDSMTAAMLLLGTPNFEAIADEFEDRTLRNAIGFSAADSAVQAALQGGKVPLEAFPQDSRRMMVANIAAYMETIDKGFKIGQAVEISNADFAKAGLAVVIESRAQNAIKTDEDKGLLKRAAVIFNKVAELTDQKMTLKEAEYGTYAIVPRKPKGFLSPKP